MSRDDIPGWWRAADRVWVENRQDAPIISKKSLTDRAQTGADLELAWRQIWGVSRLNYEVPTATHDVGSYGTLYLYSSGRCARWTLDGHSEIRVQLRGL